jgi:hypothetical protein
MPAAERFAHGTRARYTSGCRCDDCRRANTQWARTRAKTIVFHGKDPLVPANVVRAHLVQLSGKGVGRRAVSAACDVSKTVIFAIRSGKKTRIRRSTERRILAVTADARADHSLVPAAPVWKMIRHLVREGFTQRELAARLGYKSRALQIQREWCEARTAMKIERFYRMIMAGDDDAAA